MAVVNYKYPYFSEDENGKWKHYNAICKILIEPSQLYLDNHFEVNSSENNNEPTQLDRIEAQITYTAMMTDTLLEE